MKFKTALLPLCFLLIYSTSCKQESPSKKVENITTTTDNTKIQISSMLDSFNLAAAQSNFTQYFNYFAEDATYLGTDATEHWDKKAFMVWAKPFFDKKTTWNFKSIDRHIYLGVNESYAWFDELLDTPFAKMCRGSGVLVKENGSWKIQQYVLSMTIPNSVSIEVRELKSSIDDSLMNTFRE